MRPGDRGAGIEELRDPVGVLGLVVVPLAAGQDFAGDRGLRLVVAEHAHLDLPSQHAALDQDLPVVGEGGRDGGLEGALGRHLRDAHARAEVGGLDETGIAELVRDPPPPGARRAAPLVVPHDEVRDDREVVRPEHGLHRRLVHPDGRGQDAGAHVGDVGQLEETLERAVLAVRPVDEREHDVQVGAAPAGSPPAVATRASAWPDPGPGGGTPGGSASGTPAASARARSGSPPTSHWPSLAMPIGITS